MASSADTGSAAFCRRSPRKCFRRRRRGRRSEVFSDSWSAESFLGENGQLPTPPFVMGIKSDDESTLSADAVPAPWAAPNATPPVLMPRWTPTYVMNESTMIQPCNAYGPMDLATVTKWAIVNGTGRQLFSCVLLI